MWGDLVLPEIGVPLVPLERLQTREQQVQSVLLQQFRAQRVRQAAWGLLRRFLAQPVLQAVWVHLQPCLDRRECEARVLQAQLA